MYYFNKFTTFHSMNFSYLHCFLNVTCTNIGTVLKVIVYITREWAPFPSPLSIYNSRDYATKNIATSNFTLRFVINTTKSWPTCARSIYDEEIIIKSLHFFVLCFLFFFFLGTYWKFNCKDEPATTTLGELKSRAFESNEPHKYMQLGFRHINLSSFHANLSSYDNHNKAHVIFWYFGCYTNDLTKS
jgi:hypothetical protein